MAPSNYDRKHYRKYETSTEGCRKENEMDYELNIEVIKKRFENAVVVGDKRFDIVDTDIAVLIPASSRAEKDLKYFDIVSGCPWYGEPDAHDWAIRNGDRCEISVNGSFWVKRTFVGFSGETYSPFLCVNSLDTREESSWKYIRPISKLTDREKAILELEQSMKESQDKLNELKKLENS